MNERTKKIKTSKGILRLLNQKLNDSYVMQEGLKVAIKQEQEFLKASIGKPNRGSAGQKWGICPDCDTKMKQLKTCEGDPEGIRKDHKCPGCGSIWGCSKAIMSIVRI